MMRGNLEETRLRAVKSRIIGQRGEQVNISLGILQVFSLFSNAKARDHEP